MLSICKANFPSTAENQCLRLVQEFSRIVAVNPTVNPL